MSHPFLGKPAPPGYVAGVGRGATGFTTRSDIGPARDDTNGPPRKSAKKNDDEDEDEFLNESNYDEFAGYGGSLFNKDPYEEDDEEADKIYEQIDKHLDERGKSLREAKTRQELEKYRQERPKIQQQFTDLKASLRKVSEEEWMSIPDVGDARNRKQRVARQDKFTPVPDSLLAHQAKLASGGERLVYLDPNAMDAEKVDEEQNQDLVDAKPGTSSSALTANIGEMSEFRSSYMSMKLSRVSDAVDGQKAADPQDYLTNLQSMVPAQITDESTLKEYRKQFASLRASNPNFQNAWIASVRLEEAAGKLKTARALILSACERCPRSADIWCEAVRLHPPDMAKALMCRAIKEIPRSVKLWCKAAELESDVLDRRKVYATARELIPKSALLWKKSVEFEQPDEARVILRDAVEQCSEEVELWIALCKLESYDDAKEVLARARMRHPSDRSLWIMDAKLEEKKGNKLAVEEIVNKAVKSLNERGVEIKREDWFAEAEDADKAGFSLTCAAIIKRLLGRNVEPEKRFDIWREDARRFASAGASGCARAVLECIASEPEFCGQESVWLSLVDFEKEHGSTESLEGALRRALSEGNCPQSESLWLALAELQRDLNRPDESAKVLEEASWANTGSERIKLAAVELECARGRHKEARKLLADACMSAKSAQLVKRAAELERSQGNLDEAARMLEEALREWRDQADLYLMLGEIEQQRGELDKAKAQYSLGLKFCPTSVRLWISLAHLEEKSGLLAKARSRLEMARLRNPRNAQLWLEAAQLELRAHLAKGRSRSRPDVVSSLLAKGIKECADSADVGLLLAEQTKFNSRRFT